MSAIKREFNLKFDSEDEHINEMTTNDEVGYEQWLGTLNDGRTNRTSTPIAKDQKQVVFAFLKLNFFIKFIKIFFKFFLKAMCLFFWIF